MGRKNCKQCKRWRLLVDYYWTWPKDRNKPKIDALCISCRRKHDRNRYNSKSYDERHKIGKRNTEAKKRRQHNKILIAQRALREERLQNGWYEKEVSLTPFRMWLLRRSRLAGSLARLANELHYDREVLARWINGFYWESECRPVPIYGIRFDTVDEVLTRAGEHHLLDQLYPLDSDTS